MPRPHSPLTVMAAAALVALTAPGCESRYRAADMERIAQQASANRSAAAAEIVAAVTAGKIDWSAFVDLAFDKLEAAWPQGAPQPADPKAAMSAALFAGAVLDAGRQLESAAAGDDGPLGGMSAEFEIKWLRIGQLAARASAAAYRSGKLADAHALVLAGPQRWQTGAYWLRYPEHDALAAMLLAQHGQRDQALQRLRSRIELKPPADEVLKALEGR